MSSVGTYTKGVARRAEIIVAVRRVFGRDGNAGTTMRAVASEVGLSLAGLTHYFATRDELLTEALRASDLTSEAEYYERGASIGPGELMAEAMETNASNPVGMKIYVTLLADAANTPGHPAADWFRDRQERFVDVVGAYVRERQALGEIRSDIDHGFAARSLMVAADGIQNQWLVDQSIDMGAYIRELWRSLTDLPPVAAAEGGSEGKQCR